MIDTKIRDKIPTESEDPTIKSQTKGKLNGKKTNLFGWDRIRSQTAADWKQLRKNSSLLRVIDHWQELFDPCTACVYYFDDRTCHIQWEKPDIVKIRDKQDRVWAYIRRRYVYIFTIAS